LTFVLSVLEERKEIYRTPVAPDEVFGAVLRDIKASGATRLVLDLRNVGGGSSDVMESLLAHLIERPMTIGGPTRVKTYDFTDYRAQLSTWNESVFNLPASRFTPDGAGLFLMSAEASSDTTLLQPAAEADHAAPADTASDLNTASIAIE
jgi:hypothetical protein